MILKETPQLSDYQYHLPEDRIAKFPLKNRDDSKLLHFDKGVVNHYHFHELPGILPSNSLLIFNDTKVIPARLRFFKPTGARIEIFLLTPLRPSSSIQDNMCSTGAVTWQCMIGNLKRWKEGETLSSTVNTNGSSHLFQATLDKKSQNQVTFTWNDGEINFAEMVEAIGEVPLPPYLKREAVPEDKPRYQTVYSKEEGAVAAPTAGLHFTDKTLVDLKEKNIQTDYITLHVGAGTFQPIKEASVLKHPMHSEQIVFNKINLEKLIQNKGNVIAVGTTSMRSLESLYWYGVKLLLDMGTDFKIEKLMPYQNYPELPSTKKSISAVLDHMQKEGLNKITGQTEIFIFPGYDFRVCNGLVTNFHQPGSTLVLLVAAFTRGKWKTIYREALEKGYRFLSYGDSSLLWFDKI
jgi:S-adenosylmethionine:tRNA ribosyltransferase-isomerase